MATRRSAEVHETTETRAPSPQSKRTRAAQPKPAARARVLPENRRAMIAEAAYLRAERRGFIPGHEEEDWLAAEEEVDTLLELGLAGPAQ